MTGKKPKTDLHVLAAWLRNRKLEVDLHGHPAAVELHEIQKRHPELRGIGPAAVSTHQIHVTGPRGKISVVRGGCSLGNYEIYCLEGDLFDDVDRFKSVKEAGEAIHGFLAAGSPHAPH